MYTHPSFTRRGVGRMILSLSESAAAAEGFTALELMSTLAGKPLYEAADFRPIETTEDSSGGTSVPLVKMSKRIGPSTSKLLQRIRNPSVRSNHYCASRSVVARCFAGFFWCALTRYKVFTPLTCANGVGRQGLEPWTYGLRVRHSKTLWAALFIEKRLRPGLLPDRRWSLLTVVSGCLAGFLWVSRTVINPRECIG
jgi:hypothetical protein